MSKTIYTNQAQRFYVYAFLREDGTPYYIGKGQGNRAWVKRRRIFPPADVSRIYILFENLTETEAFFEEIRLIAFYGRKDQGTGCLRNLTDGGEGTSGCKRSQEYRDKKSAAMSGENHPFFGKTGEKSHNFGKKRSQDTLDKMSAAKSGEKHHMFGKKQSEDTIAKRLATKKRNKESPGENHPKFGKKDSAESRAKKSAAKSGENNPMFGKKLSPETIAKRNATRARNKEAKVLLETIFI